VQPSFRGPYPSTGQRRDRAVFAGARALEAGRTKPDANGTVNEVSYRPPHPVMTHPDNQNTSVIEPGAYYLSLTLQFRDTLSRGAPTPIPLPAAGGHGMPIEGGGTPDFSAMPSSAQVEGIAPSRELEGRDRISPTASAARGPQATVRQLASMPAA